MLKILLMLLKCCSKVPECKQRAGHTKAQQRGLLGQECYKWLSCNSDLSSACVATCFSNVLNQPFQRNHWTFLLHEHSLGLTTGPLASSGCWSFTFSILLVVAYTDISKEYSSFTGVGNCCFSDFSVTGLLCTQGLWKKRLEHTFFSDLLWFQLSYL